MWAEDQGILPRSRLYHLAPIGLGTPQTESLTGYIARLADAHGVRVSVLLAHEVAACCPDPRLAQAMREHHWSNYSLAMNGIAATAQALVQALETLTGRRALRCLTLLPWSTVVPTMGLMRRTRAWCPACFHDWQAAGAVVYEPLAWTVKAVSACPRHKQDLHNRCPRCGKAHWSLAPASRPGYCARCGAWLGAARDDTARAASPSSALTAAEAVGAMIAAAPLLATGFAEGQIAQAIDGCLTRYPGGCRALSRLIGLAPGTLSRWRRGRGRPTLALLLRLCTMQGLSVMEVLSIPPMGPNRAVPPIPVVARRPANARTPPASTETAPSPLRLAGEDLLRRGDGSLSLRATARDLGVDQMLLRRVCPDVCARIAARHRAYRRARRVAREEKIQAEVRQAVFEVHAQGVYPSTARVGARLTAPGYLRAGFAARARLDALRELGLRD